MAERIVRQNGKPLPEGAHEHGQATRNLHAGRGPKHYTHAPVIPPIYLSTTFETPEPGQADFEYSRCDNPTRTELQRHLASLEGAEHALAFSSGLGCLTTIVYGLLKTGDHVICCDDVYGGTNRFFSRCATQMGIETSFVGGDKLSDWTDNFRAGQTRLLWIETPTNPTMKLVDIEQVCREIRAKNPDCIVVVDNTFMTPIFQHPLELGADIVMHSVTKFINGHSDVIMGALMTSNKPLYDKLKFFQNALGIVPSAFDCSLVVRSIKTLENRVRQQAASALEIARFLEGSPQVERVIYPGLESHNQHELAKRQSSGVGGGAIGFSSIITIYLKAKSGHEDTGETVAVLQALKTFHTAVSLGCVCSLIQLPRLMTHSSIPEAELSRLGITQNLLRLSIGLENVEDLKADLKQAFELVYGGTTKAVGV